jgi:hypothetical protein
MGCAGAILLTRILAMSSFEEETDFPAARAKNKTAAGLKSGSGC